VEKCAVRLKVVKKYHSVNTVFKLQLATGSQIGVRMGSGKGAPEGWVAPVKRGKVMFEIAGVSEEVAREALRLASHKLPVKCKFVKREAE